MATGLGLTDSPPTGREGYAAIPDFQAEPGWMASAVDWGKSFALSAAESLPELVGITPSYSTQEWRARNPWSGLASEFVSVPLPYIGWMKAARAIPLLEKTARAAEGAYKASPFLAGAAGEAVRLLPFEVGRVGVSQLVGDEPLGHMAAGAAINLGVGSVLAGGINSLANIGKATVKLTDVIPSLNNAGDLPPQLILRKIDEVLAAQPDMMPKVQPFVERLEDFARAQTESGQTYIAPLIRGDEEAVNRLFQAGEKGGTIKKRPIQGSLEDLATYDRPGEWQDDFALVNATPSRVTRDMQYPRVIRFDKGLDEQKAAEKLAKDAYDIENKMREAMSVLEAKAATESWTKEKFQTEWAKAETFIKKPYAQTYPRATKRATAIEKDISENLTPIGDNWFLTRESEDGMFVMARKVEGRIGNPLPDDKWIIFKTDKPGLFHSKAQTIANGDIAREKWIIGQNSIEHNARPGTLAGALVDVQKVFNFSSYADASRAAGGPGRVAKFLDQATPPILQGNFATQQMKQLFKTYFLPAAQQLQRSTRGRYVLGVGRTIQGMIDTFGEQTLRGKAQLKAGVKNLAVQPFRPGGGLEFQGGGAAGVIDRAAADGVWPELWDLVRKQISPQDAAVLAAQGKIKQATVRYALELDNATRPMWQEFNRLQLMAGEKPTKRQLGHYGFERRWEGDHFTAIRGEGGEVLGIASGASRGASQREAKELAERIGRDLNRPVRIGETFIRGRAEGGGVPRDLWPFAVNPGFLKDRRGVRGFRYDTVDPTPVEGKKELQTSFQRLQRAMGGMARNALLDRHLQALSVEDPYALSVIATRFNQMRGIEGEFSKVQNMMTDRVLAPFMGNNSATKIVQVTNAALMHMQLGALKLAYPITNIVGTLQTVLPELAFVRNALPETVNGTYHMAVPLVGSAGPNGFLGVLNPLKIFAQTFREMASPSADLRAGFERAVNERVVTPRMVEEYLGTPEKLTAKERLTPRGIWHMLEVGSKYMPGASEEFARNVSFTAGWITARDIRGVTDPDAIYMFAKQFTERTNYLYSASDRPNIFNGPIGSSMGLFKNWMMNYMASMAEYARVGVTENTWSPLMWQTIGTFATGGAVATPMYWAAEGAARMFADKPLMQMAYDDFTGGQADAIMFGLPAALTGVSLSSAMTSPGANPVRDATQLFSLAIWDRAKYVQKAAGAAVDGYMATGNINTPTMREYIARAFAPVNLYRTMATWEDDAIRTLGTDLPQVTNISFYDKWLYRMGLQPVEVERQLKAADAIYSSEENRKAAISAMGQEMAEAMRTGDSRHQEMILRRAVAVGLDISAIYRSVQNRLRLQQQGMLERAGPTIEDIRWSNVRTPRPGGLFGQ